MSSEKKHSAESILLAIAVPAFILLLIFTGGFIMLSSVALIAGAVGLLKAFT